MKTDFSLLKIDLGKVVSKLQKYIGIVIPVGAIPPFNWESPNKTSIKANKAKAQKLVFERSETPPFPNATKAEQKPIILTDQNSNDLHISQYEKSNWKSVIKNGIELFYF